MKNRTWAEINLDNLINNLNSIKDFLKDDTLILAAVKGNAYGHDSVIVSDELSEHIDYFGVASVDEGIELRKNSIDNPILVLSPTLTDDIERIIDYDLIPNIHTVAYARAFSQYCNEHGLTRPVHIEIDTGMNRTGIDYREAFDCIKDISSMDNITVEGIFSHFAEAEKEMGFAIEQKQRFDIITDRLKEEGIDFRSLHFANSAAIVNQDNIDYNMVRPGIMIYGHYADESLKDKIDLKPVMTLKTRVCQVKILEKGDTVSYKRSFKADRRMKIATTLIGYGDGYSRLLSNRSQMYVNGKKADVIGKVCMDLTMLDVSHIEDIKPGDEVEVFGEIISVDELAGISGMINYEILTGIGPRVPRIFLKNNEIYKMKNIMANANNRRNNE
ncbi:MAG: alanine racemase [bacterium]